ncbi:PQQ-binding-like beta-propeller repeat protein [Cellulomonas sp.]|uniref:outer membrane protein assembly factor BamB family protein n=1 Tax=Cellulomonas sp. TaxID=40001 RepID=UPI001B192446|nr:PQQ-binding-like beta-propeller repeat protein [Cellulomonas sp.]MBO9553012.1 PQQ-binding-like beta-propeller repeat protein [Cellulomonas sp.]
MTRRPDPAVPGPVRVAVVDVASRTLVGSWTSQAQSWGVVDDRVVTALPEDDGTTTAWTLTAHDLTGTEVWTTTTSRATDAVNDGLTVDTAPLGQLAGGRGWLAVTVGDHAWVVGADGTVLADREVRSGFVYASRSGATVVAENVFTGQPQSTVLLDGAEVRAPGLPFASRADDGSAPDVELWASRDGDGLVARDASTGEELWHDAEAFPDSGTVAVQDGTVYVAHQDGVRARDAHRGTLLWRAPLPGATGVTVDGDLVLAVSANNLTALAVDPRTGRAVWKADVEDAVPADAPHDLPFLATWRHLLSLSVGDDAWVIG